METATLFNIGVANTSGRIHPELASTATESSPLFGQTLDAVEADQAWAGEEGEQIGPNALASVLDLLRATLVVENPASPPLSNVEGDASTAQGGFVLPTATSLKLADPAQIAANAEVLAKILSEQGPAAEKLRSILELDRPAMSTGSVAFAGFELVENSAPTAPNATPAPLASDANASQGIKPEDRNFKIAGAVTALVLTFNGSREQLAQQLKMGVPFGGSAATDSTPVVPVTNPQVAAMNVSRGQVDTASLPADKPKAEPTKDLASSFTQTAQDLPKMGAPEHVIQEWQQQKGMRRPGETLAAIRAAGLTSDNSNSVNSEDAQRLVKALDDVRDWVRQSSVNADPTAAATQPKSAWTLKDALLVKGGLRDLTPSPAAPPAETTSVDGLTQVPAPNAGTAVSEETATVTSASRTPEAKVQAANAQAEADAQAPVTMATARAQEKSSDAPERSVDHTTPGTLKVTEGKGPELTPTMNQAVVTPRTLDVVGEITKARPQVDVNATVREFADRVEAASLPRAARTFTMTLQPPDAGSIEVAVKAAGSMLNIEVTASDSDVQTQLDRNRGEFVQAVEQKGMTVQTFNVNASQVNVNLGQSQQGTAQQQPNAQDFQQAVNLNGTGQRREEAVPQSVPSRLTTTQIDLTA